MEDNELNQNPAELDKTEPVPAQSGEPTEPAQPAEPGQPVPKGETEDAPSASRLDAFLDDITEKPEDGQDRPSQPVEPVQSAEPAQPAEPEQQDKAEEGKKPETAEQIEAELLAEVKSERGQSRIRELLSGHKVLQQEYDSVREENKKISETLAQTGLPPEELAKVFDVCRLMASEDENDLKVALETLDRTRTDICKRLGIAQPGVNPLDDFPDLLQAVGEMEITQERALELAKLRRLQTARQQEAQQQQAAIRQQQEYEQRVKGFSQAAMALFGQLAASDPAYKGKEAKIAEALRNPAFVQTMIAKFQPEQWLDQLKFMYDNIQVAPPAPARRATPISSRPARLGASVSPEATGADRVDQLLRSVGI